MNSDIDHKIPIDISSTSSSIHQPSSQSSQSILIQSLEMPIPRMQTLCTVGPSTSRNKKRRQTLLFKVGCSLSVLLLVIAIAISTSLVQMDEKGLLKEKFVNAYKKSKVNSDSTNNGLPNYAPVNEEKATRIFETAANGSKEEVDSAESKSAAEALVCPQGVINFVINATDAKDECDGLRKAFDQTCAWKKDNAATRRRLSDAVTESFSSSGRTWMQVLKKYAQSITPQVSSRRKSRRRRLDETDQAVEDDYKSVTGTNEDAVKTHDSEMTHISPSLPTGSGHMSDEMAEDALGLNTELSDIAKAIEELGNATNSQILGEENDETESQQGPHHHHHHDKGIHKHEATPEADPVSSNKDLTSAAVAVSAIIHNPEVIEIQECCKSILQVFHDECDNPEGEEYADRRLFVIVCVIGLCGLIKSLIRHFNIRWLPEAGGCILVGVVGGLFLKLLPNIDFAFSHDMFLRVMVPPIGKLFFHLILLSY